MNYGFSNQNDNDRLYLDETARIINLIHLWGDVYQLTVMYKDGTIRRFQTHFSHQEFEEGDQVRLVLEKDEVVPDSEAGDETL